MRKVSIIVSAAILAGMTAVFPTALFADSFGLSFYDFGDAVGCGGGCTVNEPIIDVSLPGATSYSDNFSLSKPGASSILNASIGNGQLHVYSQTLIDPNASAAHGASLFWSDTFTASGPTGQTGAFRIDLLFHGTVTSNVTSGVDIGSLVNYFGMAEGPIGSPIGPGAGLAYMPKNAGSPVDQSVSFIVNWAASSIHELTTGLVVRNVIRNLSGTPSLGVTYDESNTASFTITALTAGFSYSAASSLDYSIAPVPEPSSWLLLSTGLAGLGAVIRRKKSRA